MELTRKNYEELLKFYDFQTALRERAEKVAKVLVEEILDKLKEQGLTSTIPVITATKAEFLCTLSSLEVHFS